MGFSHYRESFDVIHARSVSAGVRALSVAFFSVSLIQVPKIRDFPQFLEELAQALRPGGVVLLGDGEMQLYDEWQEPLAYSEQGSPNFSWLHSIFFAGYNAMKTRGGSVDSPSMNPTWLRNIDAFTDVGWHKVFIPIGPWRYSGSSKCMLTSYDANGAHSRPTGIGARGDASRGLFEIHCRPRTLLVKV